MPPVQDNIPRRSIRDIPIVRGLLVIVSAAALVVGVYYGTRQLGRYAREKAETQLHTELAAGRVDLRIDFVQRPQWMDAQLVRSILQEAQSFVEPVVATTAPSTAPATQSGTIASAAADQDNFFRLCNPYDSSVLGELADHFISNVNHRQNAWIRTIRSVRRVTSADGLRQTILIDAEFRKPVAFVVQGSTFYLVDADGVELPGEYSEQDRKAMPSLLVIRNVEESVPSEPGRAWNSPGGHMAIQLARLLSNKPYARQIAAINMANYGAKLDPMAAQIALDTIFPNPADPTHNTEVQWGRAPGDWRFYEVSDDTKLETLQTIFQRYNRIDAGHPYVDIRTEQPRIPLMASGASDATIPGGETRRPA